jgi:hypothetical protein
MSHQAGISEGDHPLCHQLITQDCQLGCISHLDGEDAAMPRDEEEGGRGLREDVEEIVRIR